MKLLYLIVLTLIVFISACENKTPSYKKMTDEQLKIKANELAHEFLIIDTHVDVPYRLESKWEDISQSTEKGHFDYPRAKDGGLDAPFMSIYIPAELEKTGGGKELVDRLIDMVEKIANENPDKFAVAISSDAVIENFNNEIISFPMGMENGTAIEGDLKNLKYFYDRGIRYITLAHSESNHISDSSYDEEIQWNGLSPFGEKVVTEMNRLGMMVDVSHLTDSSFYDVIQISNAPVFASHSSCRYFTPGWERNMNDEMIKTLAEHKGVIMINFGSSFINGKVRVENSKHWNYISDWLEENNLSYGEPEAEKFMDDYFAKVELDEVTVSQVADHIDRVVELAGIDYVGLGSDFDGVRALPVGLSDVSMYPNLIAELLKRDYSEEDIE
ncbi:MAG: dipeptidase, partial [Ignavibacteriaceae bacterium]